MIFMRIYIVLVYWNQPKEYNLSSTPMLHVCFLQWSNHSFVVIVTKKEGGQQLQERSMKKHRRRLITICYNCHEKTQ